MKHHYIICIGSNYERNEQVPRAQKALKHYWDSIQWAPPEETEGIGMKRFCVFTNQVAVFTGHETVEEVKSLLKAIEVKAGRKPEDKGHEVVRLDIDLIWADGKVLKPQDWQRDYVKRGVNFLGI